MKLLVKNKMRLLCSALSKYTRLKHVRNYCHEYTKLHPPWNVMFFGSDDFSLSSLKKLDGEYKNGALLSNLEVVTSTQDNAIGKFAVQQQLKVHCWPYITPQDHEFHVGVVVSFGHLIPANVINSFPLGILNVHASLLPRWRGAAPIIYAIAHGDTKTGVTVMRIKPKHFDVGDIVTQLEVDISKDIKMPELHNNLSRLGAEALVNCIKELPLSLEHSQKQSEDGVTFAPRIKSTIANIHWQQMTAREIYNLARALTGVFHLATTWHDAPVKLLDVKDTLKSFGGEIIPGHVVYDREEDNLKVQCVDGAWISVDRVGIAKKKPMDAKGFNNGYLKKQKVCDRIFI